MHPGRSPRPARPESRFAAIAEYPRISAAVLIDTVGAGFILPLSLVYFAITSGLGLPELGLIAAAATLAALPAGLVGGAVTDRFGARATMIANNLMSAVGYVLFLFVHEPVGIFAAIFLAAASERVYWSSWNSYVHRLASGRPYERWFSFLEAIKMAAMGAGAGVAALVLAVDPSGGLRWLVIANIGSSLVAAALFLGQPLPEERVSDAPSSVNAGGLRGWLDVLHDPGTGWLVFGQLLLGPLMVLPNVALSVLFISVWHLPAAVSPVLFTINTLLVAVLQAPTSGVLMRLRRSTRIWAAAGLVAIALVPLAFLGQPGPITGWSYVIVTGVLLALADILYLPPTNSIMVELPEPRHRGRAVSLFQTASALSAALFPLAIGLLRTGDGWMLWCGTALAALAGALCYSAVGRGS